MVHGVEQALARIKSRIPSGIDLRMIFDQSIFVRSSLASLEKEVALDAMLAALIVLLFLGSVRFSLIIFLTIQLSILAAMIGLYATPNTLNSMTLGGLALAVGRLVDDSIVVLENTVRHLRLGKRPPPQPCSPARLPVHCEKLMEDLSQLRAVRLRLDNDRYLMRTELKGHAHEAFRAVGLRPLAVAQPLNS